MEIPCIRPDVPVANWYWKGCPAVAGPKLRPDGAEPAPSTSTKRSSRSVDSMGPNQLIVLVIGFAAGLIPLSWLWVALTSETWPVVEGEVVECGIRRDRVGDGAWRVEVRYHYAVEGEIYEADTIWPKPRPSFWTKASAEAVTWRYQPGTRVDVYHHPSRPERAVLEPGARLKGCFLGAVGAVVILLAHYLVT